MNNIVKFVRPMGGPETVPPVAWAVAQLIVTNGLGPDDVFRAVEFYAASLNDPDEDDTDEEDEPLN